MTGPPAVDTHAHVVAEAHRTALRPALGDEVPRHSIEKALGLYHRRGQIVGGNDAPLLGRT